MLNLSYAACYDPYHTVLRMVCVLLRAPSNKLPIDTLRIADFFVCFPMRLDEFRAPSSIQGIRKRINEVLREENIARFEILPKSDVLFDRMEIIQETAISALNSRHLVTVDRMAALPTVSMDKDALPIELQKLAENHIDRHRHLVDLVAKDFASISVLGKDGLKDRTKLGEWAYDTI